jgi:hypothetical protein
VAGPVDQRHPARLAIQGRAQGTDDGICAAHNLPDRLAVGQLARNDAQPLVRQAKLGGRADVRHHLVAAPKRLLGHEASDTAAGAEDRDANRRRQARECRIARHVRII